MDGYEDDDTNDHSSYSTPYHLSSDPTWSFHDMQPSSSPSRPERPRPYRHTSLPRALYASGSSSLFGSGNSPVSPISSIPQQVPQEAPPSLVLNLPSQENLASSQRPALSTLSNDRRSNPAWYENDQPLERAHIPRVEKDADDPTIAQSSTRLGANRPESTTLTTLNRLFAVRAATSPDVSRTTSYNNGQQQGYTRTLPIEPTALPDHLYTRGLLEGRHSDITVTAFGHEYQLHRIILDRAPFFRSALSEPWLEANARTTTVHPEDLDTSISQHSFELALKRLYGCANVHEEDRTAVGLFATGCWLEMQDLIDSSIESMLRQMTPSTLAPLIKLVTSNYYGRAGDKILASAKAMLCRDGWHMPLRNWDGIPGDIIREIVGGDGFFIDGELERWKLAKKLLDRRLKKRAFETGLADHSTTKRTVLKAPDSANLMAVRFDSTYRRNSTSTLRGISDTLYRYVSLYTHPDVEPLLVLLDEGIHYVHLDFERLQKIRCARDVLGLPVLPEKVISNALWQQMELRQKVMNAREGQMELDLSVKCTEDTIGEAAEGGASRGTTMSITTPASPPPSATEKGKQKATEFISDDTADDLDLDSGSWDGNGKPRKFWIPTSDCNIVMGGNADPVIATSNNTTLQRHASRLSVEDIQWASDFSAPTSQLRPPTRDGTDTSQGGESRYSYFPPFRFAAEFPNPRLLKDRKRVYSRTIFYAGSLWNIYIQKVASSRSKQLGVYLHRAKERETEEVIAGLGASAVASNGTVDERIGQLERDMILRGRRGEEDSAGSAGDDDTDASARASTMRSLLARGSNNQQQQRDRRAGQTDVAGTSPQGSSSASNNNNNQNLTPTTTDDLSDASDPEDSQDTDKTAEQSLRAVPTVPHYVDARPTIRTYFKIYSPSRGGRMLSVYESAPDRFNFSQSWGWKSSTLMLDEGLGLSGEEDGVGDEDGGTEGAAGHGDGPVGARGDGKLRFMVVIGNI